MLIIFLLVTYPVYSVFFKIKDISQPVNFQELSSNVLKVMTYNIRHGQGADGLIDLDRIAQIIQNENVDIVGLNEVDRYLPRSKMINQLKYLSEFLEMNYFYAPTFQLGFAQYGNAVMSRILALDSVNEDLPRFQKREPRGYLKYILTLNNQQVEIIITHLGLNPIERERQLEYLAKIIKKSEYPLIVMGDFNVSPTTEAMQNFVRETGLMLHSYQPTYPAQEPNLKLDYILTSSEWERVGELKIITSLASDHLPVVGEFRLK